MSKIVATTYKYKKDSDGKIVRVGEPEKTTTGFEKFSDLRADLLKESKGVKGVNVAFTPTYENIRVAVPRKIDHLYKENKDGTFTRTFYSKPKSK